MAITKQLVGILASVSVPAGGTKASPQAAGVSSAVDCRGYYGGDLAYKITNGSSAPGTALAVTFQGSGDGSNWYDIQSAASNTTASSVTSGLVPLDAGIMYVRIICWNNTTNPVTVEANLQAITGI